MKLSKYLLVAIISFHFTVLRGNSDTLECLLDDRPSLEELLRANIVAVDSVELLLDLLKYFIIPLSEA